MTIEFVKERKHDRLKHHRIPGNQITSTSAAITPVTAATPSQPAKNSNDKTPIKISISLGQPATSSRTNNIASPIDNNNRDFKTSPNDISDEDKRCVFDNETHSFSLTTTRKQLISVMASVSVWSPEVSRKITTSDTTRKTTKSHDPVASLHTPSSGKVVNGAFPLKSGRHKGFALASLPEDKPIKVDDSGKRCRLMPSISRRNHFQIAATMMMVSCTL